MARVLFVRVGSILPDDWYLRVADQAGKMLRKEIPLTAKLPITPP